MSTPNDQTIVNPRRVAHFFLSKIAVEKPLNWSILDYFTTRPRGGESLPMSPEFWAVEMH
jgi:hypothetical protein